MVHAIDRVDPTGEIVSKLTGPAPGSGSYVATFWLKVPLSSGNANAFAVALQNPFDIDLIVVRAVLESPLPAVRLPRSWTSTSSMPRRTPVTTSSTAPMPMRRP